MNCINCPENCLSNEIELRCIYDSDTGKSLSSILSGLTVSPAANTTKEITSDDITSKSLSRSRSYICSSNIVKRDYVYSTSISGSGVLFTWDFLPVIAAFPANYAIATIRVEITGVSSTGTNVFADSKSPSAGLTINASNFPITVTITLRANSPCGDINLTDKLIISKPVETGSFRSVLDTRDLNPQSGTINLTQQLNGIESQLATALLMYNTQKELIDELRAEIETLKNS